MALSTEPPTSWVVSATPQSPLKEAAQIAPVSAFVAEAPPAGRDGFLATNSLLSFVLITHRAYVAAFSDTAWATDQTLVEWEQFAGNSPALVGASAEALWRASAVVVLHGYTTRAAAIDIESKCTEAGLQHIQLADFRNFAHGRHHWLAKHPDAAVLALVAPEDNDLARRTLSLVPEEVVRAELRIPQCGMLGGVRAIVDAMRLVEVAGRVRGIDPGRPGVPAFGGRLYSLRGIDLVRAPNARVVEDRLSAHDPSVIRSIERKTQQSFSCLSFTEQNTWLAASATARHAIAGRTFSGIVFDYDGTLVDTEDRFRGPRDDVALMLSRLLRAGVAVGIATGRGRSAGEELRKCLPKESWGSVLMGYYNGGDIAELSDSEAPNRSSRVHESLSAAIGVLEQAPGLRSLADITPRGPQITIVPRDPLGAQAVWDVAEGALLRAGGQYRMVRSSHSIDILATGVSKANLVRALCTKLGIVDQKTILRVGDRGVWPGNDAELLATPEGVSVDEVSGDPTSAWTFAPSGIKGVRATLALAEFLLPVGGGQIRFDTVSGDASNVVPNVRRRRGRRSKAQGVAKTRSVEP